MIDKTTIIDEISEHINTQGGDYSDWYIGITDDIRRRLFSKHNVPETNAWFIYRAAADRAAAEMIENYFIDLGCIGCQGGGGEDSRIVYAYLITSSTKQ